MTLPDIRQVNAQLQQLHLQNWPNTFIHSQPKSDQNFSMAGSLNIINYQENQNDAVFSNGDNSVRTTGQHQTVSANGQNCYGPPSNWEGEPPKHGTEAYIDHIPEDCSQDELMNLFKRCGSIYTFRLMMQGQTSNRGFAFCAYSTVDECKRAIEELNNYEIRNGHKIRVSKSFDNCRLFVGGIPKDKTKEDILGEMEKITEGVKDVICYPSVRDKRLNRGFVFVEYESHKAAAIARRTLQEHYTRLWGHEIAVDWAEPERQVDEEIMSKVKILYVRNLMSSTTEQCLKAHFERASGSSTECIARVKKVDDYAFIHFQEREQAEQCMETMNGVEIDGCRIEVLWSKPPDKSEQLKKQQNRQRSQLVGGHPVSNQPGIPFAIPSWCNQYGGAASVGGLATTTTTPVNLDQALMNTMLTNFVGQYYNPAAGSNVGAPSDQLSELLLASAAAGQYPELLAGAAGCLLDSGGSIDGMALGDPSMNARNRRGIGIRPAKRPICNRTSSLRDRKHPIQKTQERQTNPIQGLEITDPVTGNKKMAYANGDQYIMTDNQDGVANLLSMNEGAVNFVTQPAYSSAIQSIMEMTLSGMYPYMLMGTYPNNILPIPAQLAGNQPAQMTVMPNQQPHQPLAQDFYNCAMMPHGYNTQLANQLLMQLPPGAPQQASMEQQQYSCESTEQQRLLVSQAYKVPLVNGVYVDDMSSSVSNTSLNTSPDDVAASVGQSGVVNQQLVYNPVYSTANQHLLYSGLPQSMFHVPQPGGPMPGGYSQLANTNGGGIYRPQRVDLLATGDLSANFGHLLNTPGAYQAQLVRSQAPGIVPPTVPGASGVAVGSVNNSRASSGPNVLGNQQASLNS